MADYMFDTSGLVKHYHTEVGSIKVQQIVNNPSNRIFISDYFVCADDKLGKVAKLEKLLF